MVHERAHYRAIRIAAGWSQLRASVEAGTTPPTLRVFELLGPEGIENVEKRKALVTVYAKLEAIAASRGGRAA